MIDALHAALMGLKASAFRQGVTANNVANVNSTGYKSLRVGQSDVAPASGTRINATPQQMGQGPLMSTDQISDLAISGDGFFQVQTATGVAYTRDGAFTVDGQGYLGTPSGNRLLPNIQVPANATHIQVSRDGMVTGFFADGSTANLGQIQLATFGNSGGLIREGGNLYSPSGASGAPQLGIPGAGGRGTLISGFLETSNVDLATEMTNNIVNSNEFKMNIQVAKTADEMMKNILDLKA